MRCCPGRWQQASRLHVVGHCSLGPGTGCISLAQQRQPSRICSDGGFRTGSQQCSLQGCRTRARHRCPRHTSAAAQGDSGPYKGPSSWEVEDEWGRENETTWEDDLGTYFDDSDELSSYGYELIAGALSASLLFFFFKVLFSLIAVCWALVSVAFQYSVVAFVLIALIVFIG